jgi:hypothetical protein
VTPMAALRRPRTWIIAGVVLVVLAGAVLAALPTVAQQAGEGRIEFDLKPS